jgi:(1->4)-alpha-D-glucan 1-alpha-D-glucosylmutase
MADRPRRRGRRARVVPTSTYRLQLRPGFGFDEAAAVAPYLARLGVSHVYASPYLQATPGSAHGYDVVDPHRVNVELGGARGHRRFQDRLGELGLGQVLDIVPNHMAITSGRNPWWWDVLENGPSSRYARYFDVDWDPPEAHLRDLVLIPILGDHYGRVLEAGEIRLERHGGAFQVRYHEHALPVAPRSLDAILGPAAARVRSAELAALADALEALPPATAVDRSSVLRRHRDKEVLRRLIPRRLA